MKLENDQALPVACAYDTLVSELKERIAQGGNCPVDLQRLTYAEEELKDDRTVGDYSSMLRLYQGFEDHKEVLVHSIVGSTTLLEYDPPHTTPLYRSAVYLFPEFNLTLLTLW